MAIDPKVFKQVRKRLGLSQQELADALGLSRVTINKMERGRLARGIPDEIAERLMALKPNSPKLDSRYGEVATAEVLRKLHASVNDAHLWDNEEDES